MAYPRRPLLPCALLLAFATTACGLAGGTSAQPKPHRVPSIPRAKTSPSTGTSGSPAAKPGSSAPAGTSQPGSSASAGSTNGTQKPGTSGSPSAGPKGAVTDLKVTMTLLHTCLMQGQSQTVDVTVSGTTNAIVLMDTLYEDKKDGQTYGGFETDGKVDSKGHYSYTFTVLPNAPKGGATVFVRAGNTEHRGQAQKGFIVGAVC